MMGIAPRPTQARTGHAALLSFPANDSGTDGTLRVVRPCKFGFSIQFYLMKEIVFEILEDPEGGFTASAIGCGIHTQGENVEDLKAQLREAVDCYFDESQERPSVVRLHFVREELMAV